jgi:hypothetical protein
MEQLKRFLLIGPAIVCDYYILISLRSKLNLNLAALLFRNSYLADGISRIYWNSLCW